MAVIYFMRMDRFFSSTIALRTAWLRLLVIFGKSLVDEVILKELFSVEEGVVQDHGVGQITPPPKGFVPQGWFKVSIISLDLSIEGGVELDACVERISAAIAARVEVCGGTDRFGDLKDLGADIGGVSPHPATPDRGGKLIGVDSVEENERGGVSVRSLVSYSTGCAQGSCSPEREV